MNQIDSRENDPTKGMESTYKSSIYNYRFNYLGSSGNASNIQSKRNGIPYAAYGILKYKVFRQSYSFSASSLVDSSYIYSSWTGSLFDGSDPNKTDSTQKYQYLESRTDGSEQPIQIMQILVKVLLDRVSCGVAQHSQSVCAIAIVKNSLLF